MPPIHKYVTITVVLLEFASLLASARKFRPGNNSQVPAAMFLSKTTSKDYKKWNWAKFQQQKDVCVLRWYLYPFSSISSKEIMTKRGSDNKYTISQRLHWGFTPSNYGNKYRTIFHRWIVNWVGRYSLLALIVPLFQSITLSWEAFIEFPDIN